MKVLCDKCSGTGRLEVTVEQELVDRVLREAAEDWKIAAATICGPSRRRDIVAARRYVVRELRQAGMGLKVIGMHLGWRDHSTIHHLLQKPKLSGAALSAQQKSHGTVPSTD